MIPVGAGCYRYAATPPTPAVSARWIEETPEGWTSGAHSDLQLAGDAQLTFEVNQSIGIVCGLTPAATTPSVEPERITHGFYVTRSLGILSLYVYESGAVVLGPRTVTLGDTLKVTRAGSTVAYFHGAVRLYTSRTPLSGTIKVAASLYGAEDYIE